LVGKMTLGLLFFSILPCHSSLHQYFVLADYCPWGVHCNTAVVTGLDFTSNLELA
jgi:hypothetical protein